MDKRDAIIRTISKTWVVLRWLPLLLLMANRSGCDDLTETLRCSDTSFQIDAGSCVEITNPCGDNQWHRLDSFRLCDPPPGLYIRSERNPRARFLCAAGAAPAPTNTQVDYRYTSPSDFGLGKFIVDIRAVSVTATANPGSIPVGGVSQLDAVVTAGVAPFTFAWTPSGSLDDAALQSPRASPVTSTNYTVTVTDDTGVQNTAIATVNVGVSATVFGDSPIDAGQTSHLNAIPAGGTPPYTVSWSPAGSLDDPTIGTPSASPVNTTTYDATLTDALGAQAFGSVTVEVNIAVSASANPASINVGDQSQLRATVSGGLPPYTFSWSSASSLDDFTAQNPIAQPTSTTNYIVVVTDALGATGIGSVDVIVQSPGGLSAVLQLILLAPVAVQPDGSGSTGPIQVYRFWCEWTGLGLPDFELDAASGGTDPTQVCAYEIPGLHTIRLEVDDGLGNTDAVTTTFTSQ